MKIFHRYVFKTFLKYIVIVQLFVTILSILSSSMGDTKMLSSYDYSFGQFVLLQFYSSLLNLNVTMPITTTVATIIVILLMMRSHELMAYISIGGTVLSLAIPFVTLGAAISAGMVLSEYHLIPKVRDAREATLSYIRDKNASFRPLYYLNLWLVDGGNKLVKFDVVDVAGQEIRGVEEYFIDDDFQIERIETIDRVERAPGGWKISGKNITDISRNPPTVTSEPEQTVSNKLWDDLLKISVNDLRSLSPTQLATLAEVMKSRGLNVSKYELLFYKKFANALSVIVLLILTFPIAIDFSRNYSLIKNAALTFAMGLMFWVFQAVCYSLGEKGAFNPFLANFLPLMVFIVLSFFILYRRERAR